jgi:uncharacterized protein (TIRG00374 family)
MARRVRSRARVPQALFRPQGRPGWRSIPATNASTSTSTSGDTICPRARKDAQGRITVNAEPKLRSALALRRVLAAMLLAVVLYGAFAVWRGLDKMGAELVRFRWWTFGVACGLAFANYLLRWLKWEFYLARLKIRGVGRADSLLVFLSGFVLTVTPGKVGEVFKSLLLYETYGVPIAQTAPIIVAERVTDVIGVVILIAVGSAGLSGGLVWAALGAGAVTAFVILVANRGLSLAIIARIERGPASLARLAPKLREAYDSLATTVRPSNLVVPTILSLGAWSLECTALFTVLRGLGQTTSLGLSTFFYATSTLVGAIVPVPGGLGVTETSLQSQMQELGHVPPAASTAAMILVRFATLWFAVLVGFVALSLLRRRFPELLSARSPAPERPPGDAVPAPRAKAE